MTPEVLKFEAFGPYVKKQKIDFRNFEHAGLFLIHGKTGAGKTTVLDAITYALFGESSSGNRGEIAAMRSDFAPDDQDTSVDFTFRIGQKRYRFTRSVHMRIKKNGEKELQLSQNAFFMNEDGEYEPFFENPGVRNVRQKAEELLGLNYDQFRQVVLLPQGQFEQLLIADSAAKEEILVTLFKAERWREITEWLCAQALDLKREKDKETQTITAILAQHGCENAEELKKLHAEKEGEILEQEKVFIHADKEENAAYKNLQNAKTVENLFAEWEQAKKKVEEAELRKEEVALSEKKCSRAASAALLLPLRKETASIQKQWQDKEQKVREQKTRSEKLQSAQRICIRKLAGISLRIGQEWKEQHEKLDEMKRQHAEMEKRYQEVFSAYMDGTAYMMASRLEDGTPCPVCGSVHHPAPASNRSDEKISAEAVKNLEKEIKNNQKWISEIEQGLFVLEREREECAGALKRFEWEGSEKPIEDMGRKQLKDQIVEGEELLAACKAAEDSIGIFIQEAEEMKKAFEQAMEEFRTSCVEKGFETDEEYRAAYMTEQEIEAERSQIREYHIQREIAAANAKAYAEKLAGIEPADVEPLQKDFEMKSGRKKRAETALAETRAILDMLGKAFAAVEKREKELRKKTEEYVGLDSFSRLLRGSNGVSLQRYVLGVMLAAITREANVLLQKVHDGRYQLYRALEGTGRSRKVGLDLEVFDSYSGERRSVNSLSGGEKFLVALALSLGLSAVVQAQNGGVRIDALFIDEGFGSLDPASIENALDILASVRGASKLIGIISHVQMLKENIETTIEVKKERTGSDLIINC